MNRKIPCNFVSTNLSTESSIITDKDYQNNNSNDDINDKLHKMYEELKKNIKEIEELKQKVTTLENINKTQIIQDETNKTVFIANQKNIDNSVQNIVQDNSVTDNSTNNIIVVSFGKEDISNLSPKEILFSLKKGFQSPIALTDKMHFNDKHPENHNVFTPDTKNKHSYMLENDKWLKKFTADIIDLIYDKTINIIQTNLPKYSDKLLPSKLSAIERLIELDSNDKEDFLITKQIKDDMTLLLFNKRYMVAPIKKEMEALQKQELDNF
jgi:hypothetical protein